MADIKAFSGLWGKHFYKKTGGYHGFFSKGITQENLQSAC